MLNWEAIGAVGEIVGAAAVVGSLAFVGWQLLQNTDAIRTSTSQSHVEMYLQFVRSITDQPDVARIWMTGIESGMAEFDDIERVQFISFLSGLFRYYEVSFIQHSKGKLDLELWQNVETQLTKLVVSAGFHEWWLLRREWHSERFQSFIEQLAKSQVSKQFELYPTS